MKQRIPLCVIPLTLLALFLIITKPVYAGITNPVLPTFGSGDPGATLARLVANIWKSSVVLGAIMFIIYFVYGSLRWMTAEGDKTKFEEGRQKITNAFIGLVLLAASVALIELLGFLLEIPFLQTLSFTFPGP